MQNKEKNARTKTKVPLDSNGQNLSRTDEKRWKNQTYWTTLRVVATPVHNSKSNPVQSNPIQSNLTLHLFKQAIEGDMLKLTFQKITHMQLMWLCICSSKRFEKAFENHIGKISHICNLCDFRSVQEGDLEIILEKFCTSVTIVTLHLFKQAIW